MRATVVVASTVVSVPEDPRSYRSRSANTKAALALVLGIVVVIVALALFA